MIRAIRVSGKPEELDHKIPHLPRKPPSFVFLNRIDEIEAFYNITLPVGLQAEENLCMSLKNS